jgi:hypothetical protein
MVPVLSFPLEGFRDRAILVGACDDDDRSPGRNGSGPGDTSGAFSCLRFRVKGHGQGPMINRSSKPSRWLALLFESVGGA